jgi:hypothetical protein
MTTYAYYPEMKEVKPHHKFYDMEARPSYDYKYFYIETPLDLKGRGINFLHTIKAEDRINPDRIAYKIGWNEYRVTKRAYKILQEQYKIVREALLD